MLHLTIHPFLEKNCGFLTLLITMLVMRSNSPVFQRIHDTNPVVFSASHVICFRYTIGLLFMLPFYWREMKISHVTTISKATFLKFVLAECLLRLSGLLMHVAEQTINMQLLNNLNQLQAVWVIVLAYLIRGDKIDLWNFCNHAIIGVGVMVMCLLGQQQILSMDSAIVLACGMVYPLATLIDLSAVKEAPFGFVILFKQIIGVIMYHAVVISNEGVQSLGVVYSAEMWKWLWWYSLLYGPVALCLYVFALKKCGSASLAVGTASGFVFSIFWGIVVLAQFPSLSQATGGCFILFALVSGCVRIFNTNDSKESGADLDPRANSSPGSVERLLDDTESDSEEPNICIIDVKGDGPQAKAEKAVRTVTV